MKNKITLSLILLLAILLFGCPQKVDVEGVNLPENTHTNTIIPDIQGYEKDTEVMTTTVAPISQTFTTAVSIAVTENPEVSVAAGNYVKNFAKCANNKGLTKMTYYKDPNDIKDHALLVIVEEDYKKVLDCALESLGGTGSIVGYEKDYGVYTIKYSFKTIHGQIFHVIAITTTKQIAEKLCSNLPACNSSKIVRQYELN
ncbi:MAG: hypothetical protein ABIJ74_01070 [archaeon]